MSDMRDDMDLLRAALTEVGAGTVKAPELTEDQINLLLVTIETHPKGRKAWKSLRTRLGILRSELLRRLQ